MKRAELKAEKEAKRAEIEKTRQSIYTMLFEKRKLPDSVVNGSLDRAINYKEFCEKSATVYHVHHKPARRMTITQLETVQDNLNKILQGLMA